ncbi:MAG TPA: cytochrome C [Ramlibacter sp.]|nr:cytochrome C [Ramlibacter sp.]
MLRTSTALAALWVVTAAHCQPAAAPSRGELLYTTHCVACHDTQVHWRDGKLALDWDSLKVQVRRWQQIGRLGWDEADIDEVARYLNWIIYRYPQPLSPMARH